MANNNRRDQPGRVPPNESENQPGYDPEKSAQRGGQRPDPGGDMGNPSQRRGYDDRRKDEVSNPPRGGIDPNSDLSGEEQVERKSAGERGGKPEPRKG